jgi:hypothetical protein
MKNAALVSAVLGTAALLTPAAARAQGSSLGTYGVQLAPGAIAGQVTIGGVAVARARVETDAGQVATTDTEGNYTLYVDAAGLYDVWATTASRIAGPLEASVTLGETTTLDFTSSRNRQRPRRNLPAVPSHIAAMRAVEQRFQELLDSGANPVETIRGVGAFMATQSEYVGSIVDEATLSALGELKNGRIHIVSNNFDFDRAGVLATGATGVTSLDAAFLPQSGYARILTAFAGDPDADGIAADLEDILEGGGYQVRPSTTDATLGGLRTVNGDGYFWFNSHGGGTFYTNRAGIGQGYYAMCSTTPVTADSDDEPAIAADLANDRLLYYTVGQRPAPGSLALKAVTSYGINANFVSTYWSFSPNAVVHFTVGVVMAGASGPQDFVDAVLARGAGVVFGWTGKASNGSGYRAARYFTDRLLGANSTIGGIPRESPDQRPFPWGLVYEDMETEGLVDYEGPEISKLAFKAAAMAAVLDPSLQDLLVNEWDGELVLRGDFGAYPGRVWIGGTKREDCTWTPGEITCSLPLTGAGSKGEVWVEVEGVSGTWRESNLRQLVEWAIPLHYRWSPAFDIDGLTLDGSGTLRYRADVGAYRRKPGESPFFPLRGVDPTRDSLLTLTGSGSSTSGDCTVTLVGSASFLVHTAGPGLPFVLAAPMYVETGNHTGALGLALGLLVESPFKLVLEGPPNCAATLPVSPTLGALDMPAFFPSPDPSRPNTGPFFALSLAIAADFSIANPTHHSPILAGLTVEFSQPQVSPDPAVRLDLAQ